MVTGITAGRGVGRQIGLGGLTESTTMNRTANTKILIVFISTNLINNTQMP